jgi:Golgi phosphoprotein 3 (GPP34)
LSPITSLGTWATIRCASESEASTGEDWGALIGAATDLTTADELLLLAIDPRTGRLSARPPFTLPLALAGAMLMDLIHDQHVMLIDGKVVAGLETGEPWRDAILARIRRMPLPQGIGYWVNALGVPRFRAQDRTTWRLIERGLVSPYIRLFLGVLASTRFTVTQPAIRNAIAARVAGALTTDNRPDPQTASLIAMAGASGLLDRLVDRRHRISARRRTRSILQGDESANDAVLAAAQYTYAAAMEVYSAVCAGGGDGGGGHGGGHGGH